MKAIRVHSFGEPEVLRLEEVPEPKAGPGQVTIRIKAVGVNPLDTYIRAGVYARKPPLPYTPGSDTAGIVEDVGEGIDRLKKGDRVYTIGTQTGAYAGAGIHVAYYTAYRALFFRAHAQAGETVLVHGASGGVGIAAVQVARAAGLTVFGTGGTEAGRRLIVEQGAHHTLDHKASGYLERGVSLTGGGGFDVILEMLANVNLGKDLGALAFGGRVVAIGSRGTVEINPRDAMSRDAAVLGMLIMNASE
ncbi:MAG: Alcohol dehydrogenase, zinc-binding domain protein, partial [Deltaproteobacteria bacterium]|nr:Alcohol dehydrogenase, zinc-binding domain protein [Deltaproteobacteria bacterium]